MANRRIYGLLGFGLLCYCACESASHSKLGELMPAGAGGGGASAGGGGTSNSGGGGTSAPLHVVGMCEQLGPVGKWEDITPAAMFPLSGNTFYRPAIFKVDPLHAGSLYLGTDSFNDGHSKGLWKTVDCGANWTHVSTGRNGDAIDGGRNWTFEISPINSQVMYVNSGYYKLGLFKSIDGGVNWDDVTPTGDGAPGFASHVRMDPDKPDHLLLDWHADCGSGNSGIGCFAESTDGGATWKEHYGNPSWGSQVVAWILHGSVWIIANNGLQRTTDGGATWKSAATAEAGGHSAGQLFHAKDGSWYLGTPNGVVRSPPDSDGASWALVPNSGSWSLGITGNDTTLFLSTQDGFLTSAVNDGMTWTAMPGSPKDTTACTAGYDLDHHVLYASCLSGGFWRMRTE